MLPLGIRRAFIPLSTVRSTPVREFTGMACIRSRCEVVVATNGLEGTVPKLDTALR